MIRLDHFKPHPVIGVLLTVVLMVLVWPQIAHADQNTRIVDEVINDQGGGFLAGWGFIRSLVNYVMVGGLLVVAFASVLRINLDTYAVKKVLPLLLTGFFFGNFSLLIAKVFLTLASSLTLTTQTLTAGIGGIASTGAAASATFSWSNPVIALVYQVIQNFKNMAGGSIGGNLATGAATLTILAAVITATPAGRIIAIAILIVLALLPVLLGFALALLFTVRFYMLQFLIMVAPIAFVFMALPMTKGLFQTWFKTFMLWVFMEPAAYFVAALGLLALKVNFFAGSFGALLQYALGIGAMIFALVIPFRMGGWVMAGVAKLGKMGALGARTGLAGWGQNWSKNGKNAFTKGTGKFLSGVSNVLYAPEQFMAARARQIGSIETEAKAGAAFMLGQHELGKAHIDSLVADRGKEFQGLSARETLTRLRGAIRKREGFDRVAGIEKVYQDKDRSNFLAAIDHELEVGTKEEGEALVKELMGENGQLTSKVFKSGKNGKYYLLDTDDAKAILRNSIAGATLTTGKDSEGQDVYAFGDDSASQLAYRRSQSWDKLAKGAMFFDESGTVDSGEITIGTTRRRSNFIVSSRQMKRNAAVSMADNDVQKVQTGMNKSFLTRRRQNESDGSTIGRELDGGMIHAIATGRYHYGHLGEIRRLSGEGGEGLAETYADPKMLDYDQERLNEEFKEQDALVKQGKISQALYDERKRQASTVLAALYAYSAKADQKVADAIGSMVEKIALGKRNTVKSVLQELEQDSQFTALPKAVQERIRKATGTVSGFSVTP